MSSAVVDIEKQAGKTEFSDLQFLVAGAKGKANCIEGGDIDDGIWTVGMVMGLIHDIPSCDELLKRIMSEAHEAVSERLSILL